jgi:hypothetical protein
LSRREDLNGSGAIFVDVVRGGRTGSANDDLFSLFILQHTPLHSRGPFRPVV